MADYTFFTNPMSRGQIARWALHEVEADYEQVLIDFAAKTDALIEVNPMGKVPTLVHHSDDTDRVVTEGAAICLYLAEMHPEAGLLPNDGEMADYYRWTFFAAGPVDQAITARAFKFEPTAEQQAMAGFGSMERVVHALESHLMDNEWVCGSRFTMADVYVGSSVDWGLNFGILPPNEAFVAYADRIQKREAYKTAKAIDGKLIEAARK